jgi:hypothetical protein
MAPTDDSALLVRGIYALLLVWQLEAALRIRLRALVCYRTHWLYCSAPNDPSISDLLKLQRIVGDETSQLKTPT